MSKHCKLLSEYHHNYNFSMTPCVSSTCFATDSVFFPPNHSSKDDWRVQNKNQCVPNVAHYKHYYWCLYILSSLKPFINDCAAWLAPAVITYWLFIVEKKSMHILYWLWNIRVLATKETKQIDCETNWNSPCCSALLRTVWRFC